ncbi:MAG: hypothetical protein FI695_00120 [SAR202 cluster bacterium]|nr:hypothetical protein [Chloroflexota bacterium]MQG50368.1 hypothetical protein [SAR202 cluster bacterium]|tara:strand:+ start:447 stop:785 length:339 start_codon:yes stop_codon:yes gene_type:complete
MNFKLDLAGQLTIENDTPFANLEFKGNEINIQIKENSLTLPPLGGLRNLRKLFIEFSEWVFELGLTLKVHIKENLVIVIGEKAKPRKIVSFISGKHVEVKDTKAVINLVRGL